MVSCTSNKSGNNCILKGSFYSKVASERRVAQWKSMPQEIKLMIIQWNCFDSDFDNLNFPSSDQIFPLKYIMP